VSDAFCIIEICLNLDDFLRSVNLGDLVCFYVVITKMLQHSPFYLENCIRDVRKKYENV
jgi:hypothetical protein